MREDSCNIIGYLKDTQFVEFGKNAESSTALLYENYCRWCSANGQIEQKKDMFSVWLKQNQAKYELVYSDYILDVQGKKARGYRGIKVLK